MIYLLRHGQTDWNKEHRLQGRIDIPLNDEGKKEAFLASEKYQQIKFDVCFSSPLIRAYETAKIVLRNKETLIYKDDRLMEMCFGSFEGMANVWNNKNLEIYNLFNKPSMFKGGCNIETFEELFKRASSFLTDVIFPLLKENKNILIVSHGALISCIISIINNQKLDDFWNNLIKNCELIEINIPYV